MSWWFRYWRRMLRYMPPPYMAPQPYYQYPQGQQAQQPPQYGYPYPPPPWLMPPPMSPEDELAMLEEYRKELEEDLKDLQEELRSVEERIKELKEMVGKKPGGGF